jgi:hypothetical protein
VVSRNGPELRCAAPELDPAGKPLNSSFKSRESVEYKDELGRTLADLVRIVPDGTRPTIYR